MQKNALLMKRRDCDDLPAANLQRNDQFWNCATQEPIIIIIIYKLPFMMYTNIQKML